VVRVDSPNSNRQPLECEHNQTDAYSALVHQDAFVSGQDVTQRYGRSMFSRQTLRHGRSCRDHVADKFSGNEETFREG
jgi:hypothetical protein